jgi:hypothetical protein
MTMATRMARRSRSALVFLAAAATRGAGEGGCGAGAGGCGAGVFGGEGGCAGCGGEGGAGDQVGGPDGVEEGR